jgi:hypothetical protein
MNVLQEEMMAQHSKRNFNEIKKNSLMLWFRYETKHDIPTVPTVSMEPDPNTCFSTASANSAAASPASFLLQSIHVHINTTIFSNKKTIIITIKN